MFLAHVQLRRTEVGRSCEIMNLSPMEHPDFIGDEIRMVRKAFWIHLSTDLCVASVWRDAGVLRRWAFKKPCAQKYYHDRCGQWPSFGSAVPA